MSRCLNNKTYCYTWKIKDFPVASYTDSPRFKVEELDNTEWFLRLYPDHEGFVSIFLYRTGNESIVKLARIQFTISILASDISSNVSKKTTVKIFYVSHNNYFGFGRFISRKELYAKRNVYFPQNTLTVQCYMVSKKYVYKATDFDDSKIELENGWNTNSICLSNDFLQLYLDSELCDVQIRNNNRVFPAHKTVLCAKSPVFLAMFKNETKEKISGIVEITDLDSDTVNNMLLFMYSNSIEDLNQDQAGKLYTAAEKYEILPLKKKCSFMMKSSLSDTNLYEIYELGDLFQDGDLKAAVENYVFVYSNRIFKSCEWKNFMQSKPLLSAEIMHKLWVKQLDD